MSTTKPPPSLEPGDTIYAQHPKRGAVVVKVLAAGKDGYTAQDGSGARHKLRHETYLGHQTRAVPALKVIDQGVDGMLMEDQRGVRRFVKGKMPSKAKAASGDRTIKIDDPLLDGMKLVKKALLPMPPMPDGIMLLAKASGSGKPGLALRTITDSSGRKGSRWVRADTKKPSRKKAKPDESSDPRTPHKDDKPVPPALHKHGDWVAFRHGDTQGEGEIVASGADGVTIQTEDGREHLVRHDALLPDHPPRPKPKPVTDLKQNDKGKA